MFSGSLEYYNLTWSVESIPPLEEIRLLYRRLMVSDQVIIKRSNLFYWRVRVCVCFYGSCFVQMNETYQHPGKWQDILLIPTLIRSSGNHYIMSHVIRGLDQNSVYEAIVQAKNRYGWNEVIHSFIRLFLSKYNTKSILIDAAITKEEDRINFQWKWIEYKYASRKCSGFNGRKYRFQFK